MVKWSHNLSGGWTWLSATLEHATADECQVNGRLEKLKHPEGNITGPHERTKSQIRKSHVTSYYHMYCSSNLSLVVFFKVI